MEVITKKPIIRLRYNLNLQIIAGNADLQAAFSALTQAVTATVVQIGSKVLPASASDEDIRNATSMAYTKIVEPQIG